MYLINDDFSINCSNDTAGHAGYRVRVSSKTDTQEKAFKEGVVTRVVFDLFLPESDGMTVLESTRLSNECQWYMMSHSVTLSLSLSLSSYRELKT